ncbi:4-alpha-glucanotransferase MalQ [Acetobacterium woodii DSM 1030]|uniref:4-alpha-glucanotransferase n=2 Tax=Acetobacterium woodii TaxID=33952 RepID=H6LCQ1_ACEWD|nr:4-alpha-glucanotransferase MalQ [Acetobacterium woodii DSM 1030]
MGFTYWQILPIGPIDACFSPYKSTSAFAGNPLLIDLDILNQWGLLTADEIISCKSLAPPYSIDYPNLINNRDTIFKLAFSRLTTDFSNEINQYSLANHDWLADFALYTVLCEQFSENDWTKWKNADLVKHTPAAIAAAITAYQDAIDYQIFLQYVYNRQWIDFKNYANSKGIKIIGDMPIYIAHTSADVWCHPELFQLDENGIPINVAGVPPDYFSETGQLWGNPLYRWDVMKKNNYRWWLRRIQKSFADFDTVRIDHFRAFSAYWSVPATAPTAKSGNWIPGPARDFFKQLEKSFPAANIIAEDLGFQDPELIKLLSNTGFPGMRIMEFAFIDKLNNIHLPHNYTANMVAYSGTHDNNTLLGTFFEYSPEQRRYAFNYCGYCEAWENQWQIGGYQSPSCRAFIRTLFQSVANLVMLPIQDLCGYGSDTRINKPGTTENNWIFRMTREELSNIDTDWFNQLNHLYRRIE